MQEETRWTLPAGASALTPASDSEDGAKRDSSGYIIDSDSGSDSETDAKADDEAEELARQRWKVSRFQETAGLSSFELAETILLAAGGDVKAALAQCRADGLGIVGRIGALTVGRDPPPAAALHLQCPARGLRGSVHGSNAFPSVVVQLGSHETEPNRGPVDSRSCFG